MLATAASSHAQCARTLFGTDTGPGDRFGVIVDVADGRGLIASAYQDGGGVVHVVDPVRGLGLATY